VIRAKKSLGQHFLADKNIARNIVRETGAQPGETILEIGPGTGALTELLVNTGASVVAVDVDRRAIECLEERAHVEGWTGVRLVCGNILETDIASFVPQGTLKVVGNLPYNITSQILFRLFEFRERITSAVMMMQREVAQRICAPHGNKEYGILSVLTQAQSETKMLFKVSPNVFIPKPEVWSAVIRTDFTKNRLAEIESYRAFTATVKGAFGTRRKTLANALKHAGLLPAPVPPEIEPYLGKRAEQLAVEEFIDLANNLYRNERNANP